MACSHNTSNLMMPVNLVEIFTCYVCHDAVGRFIFILLRRWSVLQHICESLSIYVFGQITCTLLVMKCMNGPFFLSFVREHDGICLYLKAYSTDLYVALARAQWRFHLHLSGSLQSEIDTCIKLIELLLSIIVCR